MEGIGGEKAGEIQEEEDKVEPTRLTRSPLPLGYNLRVYSVEIYASLNLNRLHHTNDIYLTFRGEVLAS